MTRRPARLRPSALACAVAPPGFFGRGGADAPPGEGATPPGPELPTPPGAGRHASGRPNAPFLVVDDLRPALGAYGDETAVAPNLDRLAAENVALERAYASAPVCGTSRASLLPGPAPPADRLRAPVGGRRANAPSAP